MLFTVMLAFAVMCGGDPSAIQSLSLKGFNGGIEACPNSRADDD